MKTTNNLEFQDRISAEKDIKGEESIQQLKKNNYIYVNLQLTFC